MADEKKIAPDQVDLKDYVLKTLLTQTLLQYAKIAQLFSGNYNDLSNKPDLSQYALVNQLFNGNYNDLNNKPDLSQFALINQLFSGNYNDLSNKPDLTQFALINQLFSGDYNDLSNKPNLNIYALVSQLFSGNYNDLSNKPNLFNGNYNDLSNKPDLSQFALINQLFSGNYNDLSNKPTIPTSVFGDYSNLTIVHPSVLGGSNLRFKKIDKHLIIKGSFGKSTGDTNFLIATLPVGFRPDEERSFIVTDNTSFARINIGIDGKIEAWSMLSTSINYFDIEFILETEDKI